MEADDDGRDTSGDWWDRASTDDLVEVARPALRFGWVAKGLLFVIIGGLAIEIARRRYAPEDADQTGALATLADAPAGRVVVLVVSIGLALHAAWQLWSALARSVDDALDLAKSIGWAGLSVAYGLLAVTGLEIALRASGSDGSDRSGGGATSPRGIAERLFDVPGGRAAVVAIGLGTAAVGAYQLAKGLRGDFLDDIRSDDVSEAHHDALRILGTAGAAARALTLGVAGWLFVDAAWNYDPGRAAGLDDSLRTLAEAPLGRALLVAAGVGLGCAGLYDIVTSGRRQLDGGS